MARAAKRLMKIRAQIMPVRNAAESTLFSRKNAHSDNPNNTPNKIMTHPNDPENKNCFPLLDSTMATKNSVNSATRKPLPNDDAQKSLWLDALIIRLLHRYGTFL